MSRTLIPSPAATAGLLVALFVSFGACQGMDDAPPREQSRTFYIDSEHGRDDNSGRAEDLAWRSMDRVNAADLKPGDTVRFKRGGVWRGSLVPASGLQNSPVTYTAYGKGPKPLILGSLSRSRPEEWGNVGGNIWVTPPVEYRLRKQVLDLRGSKWHRHQEAGAKVGMSVEETPEGRFFRFTCTNSGRRSNHVQLWGPQLAVEKGTCLLMTFRARSSKPLPFPRIALCRGRSPWTRFGAVAPGGRKIGSDWEVFKAVFSITKSSEAARLHINLGGILPAGAEFDFQPQSLHFATPNIADPLAVDVGNIIFDHGKICGWKKWSVDQLDKPYDYYYDGPAWRVYLCCPANPATLHKSIELAMKRHVISQSGVSHVVYDGLAVKYGAAHGFGGGNTHHLVIRNCDLGYIGGGHQHSRNGHPVRYGNAIEFWCAAHDNLVEGCRIWEVYDAALTNQGRGPESKQVNITYRNNLIWNSEYSFEYWNNPETALTRNIRFVNNTCVNAGKVWSHAQRPNQNGSHLMLYTNTAVTSGIEVKYNVFCNVTEWGSRYSRGWKVLPDMDYNLWFSAEGVMSNWFGKKLSGFEDYRKMTGLDTHSLFADPRFVDAASGDYRLAPDSPAHKIRADGGPIGSEITRAESE